MLEAEEELNMLSEAVEGVADDPSVREAEDDEAEDDAALRERF